MYTSSPSAHCEQFNKRTMFHALVLTINSFPTVRILKSCAYFSALEQTRKLLQEHYLTETET